MRRTRSAYLLLLLTTCGFLFSCNREKDLVELPAYQPVLLQQLVPMKKGKYMTYRLDSTVTIFQGRALETRRYQLKDVWDTLVADNLGQPAWRVFRYINDSVAAGPWRMHSSYTITAYDNRVEYTENNLRVVRLQLPLQPDATWKGNRYLPQAAYGAYNNLEFADVNNWTFGYTGLASEKIGNTLRDSVWTVVHLDQVTDTLAIANPQNRLYGIGYSADKFAKGLGLVARQFVLLENNPNQVDATTFNPYKTGFAIRMWLIEHN